MDGSWLRAEFPAPGPRPAVSPADWALAPRSRPGMNDMVRTYVRHRLALRPGHRSHQTHGDAPLYDRMQPEHRRQRPGQGRLRARPVRGRVPPGPPARCGRELARTVARRALMSRSSLPPVRRTCSSPRSTYPSRVTCCARLARAAVAMRSDRPSPVLVGLLIATALVGLVVCVAIGVFGMR